jgi:hypothetical protein
LDLLTPYTQHSELQTIAALWLIYTLYSSPLHTHTLGFSVFTSRILAKDLSQSHCNFKSYVKSSLYSLIHFLPLFWNCQLNSMPSSYLCRLASRSSTLYSLLLLLYTAENFLMTTLGGTHRKHSFYCLGGVLTGPLPSNGRPSVAHVRFAGMCFPSRCLTMDIDVTILSVFHIRAVYIAHHNSLL